MTADLHAEQGKGDPFAAAMRATRMPMLITDPHKPDNPIVFANNAFLRLTGYERSEVMGRNCRFLQGPDTADDPIAAVRAAIAERRAIEVDLLNYRKDGSTFWNALYISPVTNEHGELQFFFASQLDVTERKQAHNEIAAQKERFERAVKERTKELEAALEAQTLLLHEVDHRVKNNLQMISSLILMQSRTIPDDGIKQSLRAMLQRVEALSTVHRRLYQSDDVGLFDVADFARDLVTDLVAASGRDDIRAGFDLEAVKVPASMAAPIALMVNELVTNALKHAFPNGRGGRIDVAVRKNSGDFIIDITDDGTGLPDTPTNGSFGRKLVASLARQLHAGIEWRNQTPGTRVSLILPFQTDDVVS
ncbi:MAG: PAS domain-containing protein [Rhizobiaceae bacterium]|nr:PAS domain-containing protein [Rhizobiaceae bacterium]MCV0407825.1 PAS domain-containing protein [Rhizobiaceae bacterium]